MSQRDHERSGVSRRALLQVGAGFAGGAMLPAAFTTPSFAVGMADHPALGTWPAGSPGVIRHHRRDRAAHRRLCGAGRR